MTYLLKNYLLLRFNPDYFCRVSLQNNSLFLNLKAMSSLRNSIKKADPAPEKKEEIMLNLNLLFELATSKCDHFKTQIADNIRTAGTIENPTIPITHIIADTSEMRAYCKDDSTKIVGEATNAIKSFVTGGSENVISGVGALIGAGINMLMGSGEGVQAEHSDYFIMVDGLALVRIDVKSWIRKVTVVAITQKIESVLAFTAVKSSVDVDKISFNTFMEAYKYQLQRDAAHALNENDLMKEIKRAKEVYNLLKTDSAESTLVFDTLKLPGQNIHPAFIH